MLLFELLASLLADIFLLRSENSICLLLFINLLFSFHFIFINKLRTNSRVSLSLTVEGKNRALVVIDRRNNPSIVALVVN